MRLLVVGRLIGQLAQRREDGDEHRAPRWRTSRPSPPATQALRAGQGADLLMVDYELDIAALIAANEAERIRVPVVACGVDVSPERQAADAIRAGAKEFIPLPPEAELIAAVLAAVSDDERPMIARDAVHDSSDRPCRPDRAV